MKLKRYRSLALSGTLGAITGIAIKTAIGRIGIAVCGTAIGITTGPMIAITTGVTLAGYGLYKLGARNEHKK